jgi:hypothetical protein
MSAQSQSANGGVRPGAGRPVGSRSRRRQLVDHYVQALGGGARVGAIQRMDVERAVDLILLAKTARAELAAGKTTINNVVKLENSADRAVRRLNLSPPDAAPTQSLAAYLASKQAAAETDG